MNKIKPKQIAWFLPAAYLLHLLDEYFSGGGFHIWFSGIFDVSLSLNDFILINSIGFGAAVATAVLYNFDKVNNFIIAAFGSLFFINGIVHIVASAVTLTYSPGTISGLLIYLPLGWLIFKNIFPLIPEQQLVLSVAAGIIIQVAVALIALSI